MDGDEYTKAMMLPVGKEGAPEDRLREVGFEVMEEDGKMIVNNMMFGSNAERMGIDFDQEIVSVMMEADRPPKQLMFFPALALLGLIYFLQKRRQTPDEASRLKLE
jgi:C-terminal processing protease CtpA/Prc